MLSSWIATIGTILGLASLLVLIIRTWARSQDPPVGPDGLAPVAVHRGIQRVHRGRQGEGGIPGQGKGLARVADWPTAGLRCRRGDGTRQDLEHERGLALILG